MAVLLLISFACGLGLLCVLFYLNRFSFFLLRRLWQNRQRERLISFADEFPISVEDTLFLGDTHVADFRWEECFSGKANRNLGIPDETVAELTQRLPRLLLISPQRLILHTGGTDVRLGYRLTKILRDIDLMLSTLRALAPTTDVVLVSILPQDMRNARKIRHLNQRVAELADQYNLPVIDLFDTFADSSGGLSPQFSEDGYHLWGAGYDQWLKHIQVQ